MSRLEVLVVGGGVTGLTTALLLVERGCSVTVRSADSMTGEAEPVGLWCPTATSGLEPGWAESTFERLARLSAVDSTGIRAVRAEEYFEAATYEMRVETARWWRHMHGVDYGRLEGSLPVVEGIPLTGGVHFETFAVDLDRYRAYLRSEIARKGGRLEEGPVSIEDAFSARGRLVVNCTGAGARAFLDASTAIFATAEARGSRTPLFGEVVHSVLIDRACDRAVICKEGYFGPRPLHVVPAGAGVWVGEVVDVVPRPVAPSAMRALTDEAQLDLIRRAGELIPHLGGAAPLRSVESIRPGRAPVRLEFDPSYYPQYGCHVVHNYGHGREGFSSSWGCAERVHAIATRFA